MKGLVWLVLILLAGCATHLPAPVVERAPPVKKTSTVKKPSTEKDWRPESYSVKKGDTLYGIGLEFGFDYKEIAQWNGIQPPYMIYVGQSLRLKDLKVIEAVHPDSKSLPPSTDVVVTTPIKAEQAPVGKVIGEVPFKTEPKALKEVYSEQAMNSTSVTQSKPVDTPKLQEPVKMAEPLKTDVNKPDASASDKPSVVVEDESVDWSWPTQGKVISGFSETGGTKGLDIAGSQGQPVLAAAAGKVVYSGVGLRGYGKLVILKHNKTYLSAYAHNNLILVKEGQEVAKGQKIAEMGNTDTDKVKLHFEIRKLGKPIDPAKLLPEKP